MNTGELVAQLENISEALGDLSITRLRDALSGDDENAAADEKRLARARRAVDKAAGILAGMPDSSDD